MDFRWPWLPHSRRCPHAFNERLEHSIHVLGSRESFGDFRIKINDAPAGLEWTKEGGEPISASVWQRPVVSELARDELGRRQARAAVAALRLGDESPAWDLLKQRPDPRTREFLIEALPKFGANPLALIARLPQDTDAAVRQALLLTLGGYSTDALDEAVRKEFIPVLIDIYRSTLCVETQFDEHWARSIRTGLARQREELLASPR